MAEPNLDFVLRQQSQILDELAEIRLQIRAGFTDLRDSITVLTAMAIKSENNSKVQQEVNALLFDRLRKLGEAQP
jgi:hypothetical protein